MLIGLTTISLGGRLGKIFGKKWELYVKSPAEAIHAINVNTKGKFREYLEKDGHKKYYKVSINNRKNLLDDKQLKTNCEGGRLFISPIIKGKESGIGKIIAGVVLVIVGAILIYTGIGAGAGVYLINMGVGLIAGGIVQLLTPVPTPPKDRGDTNLDQSKILASPTATSQGGSVGVIYGVGRATPMPISITSNSSDPTINYPTYEDDLEAVELRYLNAN